MGFIYLIRHAQAGSRSDYDVLSGLGERQARLLGEYFVRQGIRFDTVYSGSMRRQRHTAEIACSAFARAGLPVPDVVTDEGWNEFSLLSVYRAIAHKMIDESPEFARDYEEMQEALRLDPHITRGATGRCDAAVIRAWMESRYSDYEGQSWADFRQRIESCSSPLLTLRKGQTIAVFTSATPIAILTAAALGLTEEKLVSILGVIYNTSVSVMRGQGSELRLFTYNSTPHLPNSLRTFR